MSMMQKYFSMAGLSQTSDMLFRAIVSTKNGECLRRGGGLSYSCLRELLLSNWAWTPSCLACIAYERVELQLQLMLGCQIRLFKRHGRWRSESAKDGYVKDSVERWLSVPSKRRALKFRCFFIYLFICFIGGWCGVFVLFLSLLRAITGCP